MIKIVVLCVMCSIALFAQQTVIKGKLLGADGKPMALAHIHLYKPLEKEALSAVQVEKNGNFSIKTNEQDIVSLKCSGVNHIPMEIPLLISEKEKTIELSIQLRTHKYFNDLNDVEVVGNTFNSQPETKKAEKQIDGTFKVEYVPNADTFAYEVKGITDRLINGTQSDAFRYDGDGDYYSLLKTTKDSSLVITIDPKKFFVVTADADVRVLNKKSVNVKFLALNLERARRAEQFMDAVKAFQKSGKNMREFGYDWSKDSAHITRQITKEKSLLNRQILLLSYGELAMYGFRNADKKLLGKILEDIPPSSLLWTLNPRVMQVAATDQLQFEEFAKKVVASNPSTALKANVLFNQMMGAKFSGNTEKFKEYYTTLTTEYAGTQYGKIAKERFVLESGIAVGKKIPFFSVTSLDDSTKTYSSDGMKGKIFMIDFWAVWCGPCVEEMQTLHKAYEKYKGKKNFEILSLSYDASPNDVTKFRKEKWAMPWLHSFLKGGFESEVGKKFEVMGIPKPILVDENGTILAMEGELRGDNLDKTLAKYLSESK